MTIESPKHIGPVEGSARGLPHLSEQGPQYQAPAAQSMLVGGHPVVPGGPVKEMPLPLEDKHAQIPSSSSASRPPEAPVSAGSSESVPTAPAPKTLAEIRAGLEARVGSKDKPPSPETLLGLFATDYAYRNDPKLYAEVLGCAINTLKACEEGMGLDKAFETHFVEPLKGHPGLLQSGISTAVPYAANESGWYLLNRRPSIYFFGARAGKSGADPQRGLTFRTGALEEFFFELRRKLGDTYVDNQIGYDAAKISAKGAEKREFPPSSPIEWAWPEVIKFDNETLILRTDRGDAAQSIAPAGYELAPESKSESRHGSEKAEYSLMNFNAKGELAGPFPKEFLTRAEATELLRAAQSEPLRTRAKAILSEGAFVRRVNFRQSVDKIRLLVAAAPPEKAPEQVPYVAMRYSRIPQRAHDGKGVATAAAQRAAKAAPMQVSGDDHRYTGPISSSEKPRTDQP
jgi:hypothetical protein